MIRPNRVGLWRHNPYYENSNHDALPPIPIETSLHYFRLPAVNAAPAVSVTVEQDNEDDFDQHHHHIIVLDNQAGVEDAYEWGSSDRSRGKTKRKKKDCWTLLVNKKQYFHCVNTTFDIKFFFPVSFQNKENGVLLLVLTQFFRTTAVQVYVRYGHSCAVVQ